MFLRSSVDWMTWCSFWLVDKKWTFVYTWIHYIPIAKLHWMQIETICTANCYMSPQNQQCWIRHRRHQIKLIRSLLATINAEDRIYHLHPLFILWLVCTATCITLRVDMPIIGDPGFFFNPWNSMHWTENTSLWHFGLQSTTAKSHEMPLNRNEFIFLCVQSEYHNCIYSLSYCERLWVVSAPLSPLSHSLSNCILKKWITPSNFKASPYNCFEFIHYRTAL